jgi:hypothetical protein
MDNEKYENCLKKRKADFMRKRKMPFPMTTFFMPGIVKESAQTALDKKLTISYRKHHVCY